jgi:hypothetical protein
VRLVDLDNLSIGMRDELGSLLREEARRLRRTLDEEQAWGAWRDAPLEGTGWEYSLLADVGRVRVGTRRLMTVDRWQAHQIVDAMLAVALHVCPDAEIARLAIWAGIADAQRILGTCCEAS